MPPDPRTILGLDWSEEAEEHIERHIDAWQVEELIEGGDFFVFANTAGHAPNRWRVVGRTSAGLFLTVVLEEAQDGDPFRWRPVTGWRAVPYEQELYIRERERRWKKEGRTSGEER
jgi:hypothetical protein